MTLIIVNEVRVDEATRTLALFRLHYFLLAQLPSVQDREKKEREEKKEQPIEI